MMTNLTPRQKLVALFVICVLIAVVIIGAVSNQNSLERNREIAATATAFAFSVQSQVETVATPTLWVDAPPTIEVAPPTGTPVTTAETFTLEVTLPTTVVSPTATATVTPTATTAYSRWINLGQIPGSENTPNGIAVFGSNDLVTLNFTTNFAVAQVDYQTSEFVIEVKGCNGSQNWEWIASGEPAGNRNFSLTVNTSSFYRTDRLWVCIRVAFQSKEGDIKTAISNVKEIYLRLPDGTAPPSPSKDK